MNPADEEAQNQTRRKSADKSNAAAAARFKSAAGKETVATSLEMMSFQKKRRQSLEVASAAAPSRHNRGKSRLSVSDDEGAAVAAETRQRRENAALRSISDMKQQCCAPGTKP